MAGTAGAGGVDIVLEPPLDFILRQTGAFQRALFDFSSLFEMFKPIMAEIEEEQWATGGHGAWPPLSPHSKAGPALMVQTGDLMDSLVDPNRAMQISADHASYGTDVDYAHWHQTGGTVTGRPPVRQVIPDPLPVEARRRIETAQVAWINAIAARTFGRI